MSSLPESSIRKQVDQYLTLRGWYCWATHSHDGIHRPSVGGLSDFEAVKDGEFIAVEVKSDKGKLRPAQVEHAKGLSESGIRFIVCRSVEDLKRQGI